jgi:outer membrane lipoprotein-sorting protein
MFSSRNLRVASLFSLGAAAAVPALAAQLPAQTASYTANQSIETGGQAMSMKVWRAGEKMRAENAMGMTMILETAKNRMVMLMPGGAMAMAMPLDPAQMATRSDALGHCAVTPGARETIEGEATVRYTLDCPAQGATQPWKGTLAMTSDGIPMRMDMQLENNGRPVAVTTRLSDVKRGVQDPALFTVPAGVQVREGMPTMPGMPGGGR